MKIDLRTCLIILFVSSLLGCNSDSNSKTTAETIHENAPLIHDPIIGLSYDLPQSYYQSIAPFSDIDKEGKVVGVEEEYRDSLNGNTIIIGLSLNQDMVQKDNNNVLPITANSIWTEKITKDGKGKDLAQGRYLSKVKFYMEPDRYYTVSLISKTDSLGAEIMNMKLKALKTEADFIDPNVRN